MKETKIDPQKIAAEVERLRQEFAGDSVKLSAQPGTETEFSVTTTSGKEVIKKGKFTRVSED